MTSVPHSGAKSVTPGGSVAGHTPGPWDYVPGNEHHGPYITSDYGSTIADCYVMSRENAFSSEETRPISFLAEMAEPNARLIAAAPELLEAALLAEGILGNDLLREQMSGDGDYQALTAAVAQLQKAIAKATAGETRNAEPIHRRDGDEG